MQLGSAGILPARWRCRLAAVQLAGCLSRQARMSALLKRGVSQFEAKMMTFDNHTFGEVESMSPETLDGGIQMKLITPLLLGVVNQPIE